MLLLFPVTAALAVYTSHKDKDSGLFLQTYPQAKDTLNESCDTCHKTIKGKLYGDKTGTVTNLNSCDSCHYAIEKVDPHRDIAIPAVRQALHDMVNPYGRDYLAAGRNAEALAAVATLDSDDDGFSNIDEINAGTNPGDRTSSPKVRSAPAKIISLDDISRLQVKQQQQTMFVNVTKSKEGDTYSDYSGYNLYELLEKTGISQKATSVDIISIDGYMKSFSIAQLKKRHKQSAPVFGLDKETLGECGWVKYNSPSIKKGVPLPPAEIMLTTAVNGAAYGSAGPNEKGGMRVDGPFRVTSPQLYSPGIPDIGLTASAECSGALPEKFRYHVEYEKNSDYCVKSVIAIRVNPLPAGTRDFDWQKDAMKYISEKRIAIYGAIK